MFNKLQSEFLKQILKNKNINIKNYKNFIKFKMMLEVPMERAFHIFYYYVCIYTGFEKIKIYLKKVKN